MTISNAPIGKPLNFYDYNPLPGQKKLAPLAPGGQVNFDKYSVPTTFDPAKLLGLDPAHIKSIVAKASSAIGKNVQKTVPLIPASAKGSTTYQPIVKDPPPSTPAADPNASLYAQIAALLSPNNTAAAKLAAQQAINQAIGDYHLQQKQLMAQGQSTALNMMGAANAAGQLGAGTSGILQGNYDDTAKQLAAIAGGYTGALANTETGQAHDIQSLVGSIGGSASATAPNGLNLQTSPGAAAGALADMHGTIPASLFNYEGLNEGDAAGQMTKIIGGGGTQAGLLAKGAANQKANALFANITNTRQKLPGLVQQYLASMDAADQKKALTYIALAKAGGAANGLDVGASNFFGYAVGKNGLPQTDASGNLKLKANYHLGPNGLPVKDVTPKTISPTEQRSRQKALSAAVTLAVHGSTPTRIFSGGAWHQQQSIVPLSPADALTHLESQFPWASKAQLAAKLKVEFGNIGPGGTGWPTVAGTGPLANTILGGQANPPIPAS